MTVKIRDHFLQRDLRYIFSYTVELQMKREEIGLVPGGVRVNILAKGGEVFQVLNERAPWSEGNIRGQIIDGTDWAFMREDDIGAPEVRLAFKTVDGAYIESRYKGIYPLGPGGYRELLREFDSRGEPVDLPGTPEKPFIGRVFVSPTYETSHPRYQWLTKLQCVGYGEVKIIRGEVREVSIDVYAMA